MQSLTLTAGDPMLHTESIEDKNEKKTNASEEKKAAYKFEKNIFTSVVNFICIVSLKLKLKEVGSSIQCRGRVKVGGTKNIKIGNNCTIDKNVHFRTEGRGYIHLGKNVHIGKGVRIVSNSNITIEDNAYISDHVLIRDSYGSRTEESKSINSKAIYIGKNTWIGKGTRIHAGITLGHDSTITPHSIVARSIPPEVIAGGRPAKVITDRK